MGIRYKIYTVFKPVIKIIYRSINIGRFSSQYLVDINDLKEHYEYVLILGSKIGYTVTPILKERLDYAIDVHDKITRASFVLSGTPKISKYPSDVDVMRDYLLKNSDISEDKLVLDYEGVTTFDSFRAWLEHGRPKHFLIITNAFHMPRALYIARKLGLDAYGLKLMQPEKENNYNTFLRDREIAATFKAVFKCALYNFFR